MSEREQEVRRSSGRLRKFASSILAGGLMATQAALGAPHREYRYEPPSSQVTNEKVLKEKGTTCPENTSFAILNVPGVGNNRVGVYASSQTERILADEEGTEDICYIGFVYGTEYNLDKNTDELRRLIVDNKLERVMIFAHSFGAMAMVDTLNKYKERYPDDTTQFSLTFFSSPAEADDLQLGSRIFTDLLSSIDFGTREVYGMTLGSILGQGDKSLFDKQVLSDTEIAASDTPPIMFKAQLEKIESEGMNKLSESLDIPVILILDTYDRVIDAMRVVSSIERRLGRKVIVHTMHHTNNRMENHGALWWYENKEDYEEPVKFVVETNTKELDKRQIAILAQMAVFGKARLTTPPLLEVPIQR